jgi:simple sugar transport system ATP-binding protein
VSLPPDADVTEPILRLEGLRKRFGAVAALDGIDVSFAAGAIHAVLGENGAGKSTLMNAIFGIVRPDAGRIFLAGREVRLSSPLAARRAGIGMVHQDFALVDALSVVENLALALSPSAALRLRPRRIAEDALRLAAAVGLDLGDLDAPVGVLPVGTRQRIEIVKALAGEPAVLILDEPTAVLTAAETAQLFAVLDRLRRQGACILFISHKLDEVMRIADDVTVMRRGRVVAVAPVAEVTAEQLAHLMVGDIPPRPPRPGPPAAAPPALRLERVSLHEGARGLHDIDLHLRAGEVFSVAGVDGNGQDELFAVLTGLRRPSAGSVTIGGRRIARFAPEALIEAGVAAIPPDRRRQGAIQQMSVADNAVLNVELLGRLAWGPLLSPSATRRLAAELVDRYAIKAESLDATAAALSGGNLQRLIVARALAQKPKLLVAFNPTRGLDLAAAHAVYEGIDRARAGGTAVLLISTDLDEVLEASDRIAVLYRGRLSAAHDAPVDAEELGLMMGGSFLAGERTSA